MILSLPIRHPELVEGSVQFMIAPPMRAYPMSIFRAISIGACLIFITWFAVFGGEVFLPILDRESERHHWRDYLAACHPNELRILNYIGGYELQRGTLDLSTGQLTGEPAPVVTSYSLFWMRIESIFHTINFPILKEPYREDQLAQIKAALASLPQPPHMEKSTYRFQIHVACYEDNQLRIYDYPKGFAKPPLSPLFQALGFSLLEP